MLQAIGTRMEQVGELHRQVTNAFDIYTTDLSALIRVYVERNNDTGQDRITKELEAVERSYTIANERYVASIEDIKNPSLLEDVDYPQDAYDSRASPQDVDL